MNRSSSVERSTLERAYDAAQLGVHVDLIVRCGSVPFALNAAVVAAECGYFQTVLSTLIGPERASRVTETSLAECNPEVFALVVRCIYTGTLDIFHPDTKRVLTRALEVLALAVFLDCGTCERLATRLIAEQKVLFDPDTAVSVWIESNRIGARGARREAAGRIAATMPRAARCSAFLALSKTDLVSLLSADEFSVRTEVHITEALCAWCAANGEQCTALDSLVVRHPWNAPAPRNGLNGLNGLNGILVLRADDTRFRFFTAGHEWTENPVPDLTSPRGAGAASCLVDNAIFVFGGSRARPVEKHTLSVPLGRSAPWLPSSLSVPWAPYDYGVARSEVSCATIGSCIYVVGGVSGLRPCDHVDVFDSASGLKGLTRIGRARRSCVAAETNGALLVAGGFDSIGSALANAEFVRLHSASGSCAPMLEPRAAAAHATVGADVYVAGGIGALHEPVRSAEYFNAATQAWAALPPMPRPRAFCAGAALGTTFYVVGGTEGGRATRSVFALDLVELEWSEVPAPAMGECTATTVSCFFS